MSDPRVQRIARKLQQLEVEAELQRAALADHLAQLEQKRFIGWMADAAQMAGRVAAAPGVRWLVFGALLRRLGGRRFGGGRRA